MFGNYYNKLNSQNLDSVRIFTRGQIRLCNFKMRVPTQNNFFFTIFMQILS